MAVSSVSSSVGAMQPQSAQLTRHQSQPQPNTQSAEPTRAQAQRTAESSSAERPEKAEPREPNKPVVNAQGQQTGTIINTTA